MTAVCQEIFEYEFFKNKKKSVVKSPKYKVVCRTVPKTCKSPHDEKVENLPFNALSVTAERNINIFFEPCRKGNMPSSPKVCNRLCDVGIVKVFKKLESHHIAKTASHIGVTREIKVNLECIGYHTHPCSDNTVFIGCCKMFVVSVPIVFAIITFLQDRP